jgi:hypothetical protein
MRQPAWHLMLALVAAAVFAARAARADTVYMDDGRILHGKVTEDPDGNIELTTPVGTITFAPNEVSRWEKDDTTGAAATTVPETQPTTPPIAEQPETPPVGSAPEQTKKHSKSNKDKQDMASAAPATQPAPPAPAAVAEASPPTTLPTVAAAKPPVATTQPTASAKNIPDAKRKNEPAIRALLASRWNDLDSLVVTADEHVTGDQTGDWKIVFRFFGDRAYWERSAPAPTKDDAPTSAEKQICCLLPDKVILVNSKGVTLKKPSPDTYRLDDDLDVALGYRAPLDVNWLTPDELETWKMKFPGGGMTATISLSITVPDQPKANRLITYSKDNDYATSAISVMRQGMQVENITCDNFQDVGAWRLPGHIVVQTFGDDGQPAKKTEISIKSFVLNDPKNTPDTYSDFWPAGTPVSDQSAQ